MKIFCHTKRMCVCVCVCVCVSSLVIHTCIFIEMYRLSLTNVTLARGRRSLVYILAGDVPIHRMLIECIRINCCTCASLRPALIYTTYATKQRTPKVIFISMSYIAIHCHILHLIHTIFIHSSGRHIIMKDKIRVCFVLRDDKKITRTNCPILFEQNNILRQSKWRGIANFLKRVSMRILIYYIKAVQILI
jgi:hypothetical protein